MFDRTKHSKVPVVAGLISMASPSQACTVGAGAGHRPLAVKAAQTGWAVKSASPSGSKAAGGG